MYKIVLIEDNKEVRENTAEILELAGYIVITAPDGRKGVDEVLENKPDLVICDIMMPVLDGYGVLHLLSKNAQTTNIPFVFLTAKTERSDVRKGMEMGAADYITKPFDKIELLNAVETRLKKANAAKLEYAQSMTGLNLFVESTAGEKALQQFKEGHKLKQYKKKENIYREGDFPRGLYFINKGKIKLYKVHNYGKEFITSLLNEGEFFGYTALLEEMEYNETAQALEDCELTFIPKEDFYRLVYNDKEVSHRFLFMLTNKVHEQQQQLVELAYSSVRKRVAETLLMLEEKYTSGHNQPTGFSVSREDLANMVGTATESLIRALSDFKEDKLIEIKEGKISLLNKSALSKLRN